MILILFMNSKQLCDIFLPHLKKLQNVYSEARRSMRIFCIRFGKFSTHPLYSTLESIPDSRVLAVLQKFNKLIVDWLIHVLRKCKHTIGQ